MDKTREGDDHSQSFLRVSRLFKEILVARVDLGLVNMVE
jgi:hypothetical protein